MKETFVHRIKEVTLKDPILVEGLPGVGHVGKLVADHIVEELKAEKIMEIYSPHFPPQVIVKEDGTIKQVRNEIYAYKGNGERTGSAHPHRRLPECHKRGALRAH